MIKVLFFFLFTGIQILLGLFYSPRNFEVKMIRLVNSNVSLVLTVQPCEPEDRYLHYCSARSVLR